MKKKLFFTLIINIILMGCITKNNNKSDKWSEKELGEWFSNGDWKQGWDAVPDESVNQKEFARLYFENQKRWNEAFQFLSEQNFEKLEKGRYELKGTDLFVSVDEYVTQNEEDVLFEIHKKYADIQVLISGEEKIGVLPLGETTMAIPYDESKDVMFLNTEAENYRIATPGKFFLFFPDDAHRPSVKLVENSLVKKIVVKVRIN